jgi:hypothetical protein
MPRVDDRFDAVNARLDALNEGLAAALLALAA